VYVRWKQRPARRGRSWSVPDEHVRYAVLVESRRADGKPRQRVVKHLAAIRDGDLQHPMTVDRFWAQADAVLDELGIHGADRLAMEATVAARVPRPEPVALAEHRRSFEAWKAGLQAMAQRRRTSTA
jgi:hypothetical protein